VLAGGDDGARHYQTRARSDARRGDDDARAVAQQGSADANRDERRSEAPTAAAVPPSGPKRRVVPIVIALGVVGLGATIAAWQLGGSREGAIVASTQVDAASSPPADTASDPADAVIAHLPDAVIAHLPDDASLADARVAVTRPVRPPPVDAAVVAADEVGFVQVLGEEHIGLVVYVDGRRVGTVPYKHRVRVGPHRVELELRDGTRLPAKSIDVRATHTQATPLVVSF
jgi:hypothetical protein